MKTQEIVSDKQNKQTKKIKGNTPPHTIFKCFKKLFNFHTVINNFECYLLMYGFFGINFCKSMNKSKIKFRKYPIHILKLYQNTVNGKV